MSTQISNQQDLYHYSQLNYYLEQQTAISSSSSRSTDDNRDDYQQDSSFDFPYNSPQRQQAKIVLQKTQQFKTELCKNFMYKGVCPFGDKCNFAHGEAELKCKICVSHSYKTKPCKAFFANGFCLYGQRCQFLHSEIKNIQKYGKEPNDKYSTTLNKLPEIFRLNQKTFASMIDTFQFASWKRLEVFNKFSDSTQQ